MVAIYALNRKKFVRHFVEQFVEFHPNMTESQREESILACLEVIALSGCLGITFIGSIYWFIL